MSSIRTFVLCTSAFTLAAFLGGCGANSVPVSNNTNHGTGPVPTVTAQAVEVNGVAPNRRQEVQFSEAMDPATINTKTFVITDAGGNAVAGDVSYDSNFKIGFFQPTPALETGTTYTATITTGAASVGGIHLAAPFAYSFTTRADTDRSPLVVKQVSPAANAVCVSASAQIMITFNEAPDASTVTAQNIVVTDSSGNKIATTLSMNVNTTQVVVTPTSPLPSGTITITVSGVADLADVAMQQPYTWSFSTACNGGGGGGGGAAVQVVYVVDGSTLTTYDVNSQTLQARQAGTVTLPQAVYPNMIASPDGHFLYYSAYADLNQTGLKLWVYATNSSGVPQNPPVQELDNVSAPKINPAGTLAYTVSVGPSTTANGIQTTSYQIVSYQRDPATGLLSNPTIQATYDLETDVSALNCSLSLDGFSPLGDELYNQAYCGAPHGSASATYNERSVNPATGALGPNQQIFSWQYGSGGANVQFARNLLFDFAMSNPTIDVPNFVNVYPVQPNTSTPVAQCTSTMQAVCGSFQLGNAHPSGQYAFLTDLQNVTQILRVDTTAMQLTPTGISIPYEVQQFSPDGQVAYGVNDVNGAVIIEIYGFNSSSAAVTRGGTIQVPSTLDSWFVSERY